MSFLSRTTPLLRTTVRASALQQSSRLFSTAVVHQKSATEAVKDGLKKVDRAVSDVAVAGIDKTAELKDKASEVAGVEIPKAKGKAAEVSGEAKGKAAELSGEAKGKAEEVKGKIS
ncbi:hypothetical protein A1O3_05589 [Capronia epimyces CBS 606.96]|uniref:LEA domain-containing protein n=1 Tax=Capronia epimyces CBS 606.96 TaxID=1182542 RepID=W9YRM1_9EURO|nr:uncharacterized protein A1O3_05589 [Capronia epimyces CBS 606.96]EXJ84914.1 hypothetical protein A1O3_05589 [Capronia epimyces CBS 606.96]